MAWGSGSSQVVVGMNSIIMDSLFDPFLDQAFCVSLLIGLLVGLGASRGLGRRHASIGAIAFGNLLGNVGWLLEAGELDAGLREVCLIVGIATVGQGKLRGASTDVRFAELACSCPFYFDAMLCHADGSRGNWRNFVGDMTDPDMTTP